MKIRVRIAHMEIHFRFQWVKPPICLVFEKKKVYDLSPMFSRNCSYTTIPKTRRKQLDFQGQFTSSCGKIFLLKSSLSYGRIRIHKPHSIKGLETVRTEPPHIFKSLKKYLIITHIFIDIFRSELRIIDVDNFIIVSV